MSFKLISIAIVLLQVSSVSAQTQKNEGETKIIKVSFSDKATIKVFSRFFVNDSGIVQDVRFLKVECSVCSDSLISDGEERAKNYIMQSHYKVGYSHGKPIGLYYNLPLTFKY